MRRIREKRREEEERRRRGGEEEEKRRRRGEEEKTGEGRGDHTLTVGQTQHKLLPKNTTRIIF